MDFLSICNINSLNISIAAFFVKSNGIAFIFRISGCCGYLYIKIAIRIKETIICVCIVLEIKCSRIGGFT